jgi:hypothetical protein
MSDMKRLNNIVTYVSDDGTKQSWIDHVLSSAVVDNHISNINTLSARDEITRPLPAYVQR